MTTLTARGTKTRQDEIHACALCGGMCLCGDIADCIGCESCGTEGWDKADTGAALDPAKAAK